MRVGFETSLVKGQLSGVGVYTLYLLNAMKTLGLDVTLTGFSKGRWSSVTAATLEGLIERNIDGVSSPGRHGTFQSATGRFRLTLRRNDTVRRLWRSMKEARFLRSLDAQKLDIFHAFAALPPATIGAASNVRQILLIHDVSHLTRPDFHPPERLRWLERLPHAIRGAAKINTVSEYSRREIANAFGIAPETIVVTPPGVASLFAPASAEDSRSVLDRFDLTAGRYFLVVGSIEPRKNLNMAVQAYWRLPEHVRQSHPLLVAGPIGPLTQKLPYEAQQLRRKGQLRVIGYCGQLALARLYANAALFLFPSFYEGFGIPLAEAMACGCAVAYSDIDALREVSGGLGTAIAPDDIDGWSAAMNEAASATLSPEDKDLYVRRSRQFTWDDSARKTWAMYQDVMGLGARHDGAQAATHRESLLERI